jgi:hypothetical protein
MAAPQGFAEPGWVAIPGVPGGFAIDKGLKTTWVRTFHLNTSPTWVELGDFGQVFWEHIAKTNPETFATEKTRSRIVATMCYPNNTPEGYTIFQSTIPRGTWRDRITGDKQKKKAERTAPRWCRAAYKAISAGADTNLEIHAEDSAAFLCERAKGTTMGCYELSRMVPYGHNKQHETPDVIPVCTRGGKQPTCKEVTKRLHIWTATTGADLKWMDNEAPKYPQPAGLLTFAQYWEKRNNKGGHSSGSDELDNVLKLIEDTGCKDSSGRYTYRGRIPVDNKKSTAETIIVNPYGVEHKEKRYFCFTEKGAYLTNPPLVDTWDPKYNAKKAQKLYAIAKQLYDGTLDPAYHHEDEDYEMSGVAYEAFVASQSPSSSVHAGPSATTGSRPGSRGSATGQPATGSRPSSRGSTGPAGPGPATQAHHGQNQYYQQPHPQQHGYQQHPQPGYHQHHQQQHHQQQHHPQQQHHHQPIAHAGPSQPAAAPVAQSAATLPYRPHYLARPGTKEAREVLFDPFTEHYVVKGVSDSKPDKAYQIFWSDKKKKFYFVKNVTDSKGKKKTEPVYLDDRTNYQ